MLYFKLKDLEFFLSTVVEAKCQSLEVWVRGRSSAASSLLLFQLGISCSSGAGESVLWTLGCTLRLVLIWYTQVVQEFESTSGRLGWVGLEQPQRQLALPVAFVGTVLIIMGGRRGCSWEVEVNCMMVAMVAMVVAAGMAEAQLKVGYYDYVGCTGVEQQVRRSLRLFFATDATAPAAMLRVAFHDCQVGPVSKGQRTFLAALLDSHCMLFLSQIQCASPPGWP